MKFLHTSDWHLGQTFYEYDRYEEHQAFLDWLIFTLAEEHIDVLLVSGDIFDTLHPSVASTRQLYRFLRTVTQQLPHLQVVLVAGNHDSAIRLEMPLPLLEDTHVHIIGHIRRKEDKSIDYESICIPLHDAELQTKVWCVAVPFLRWGDYPKTEEYTPDYAEGVQAFYEAAAQYILAKKQPHETVLAMGHLHAHGAHVQENDTAERPIVGGLESIDPQAFSDVFLYVALGHIHKAQSLSPSGHVRYSGSPIPLSFSEKNYPHQVVVFDIDDQKLQNLYTLPVPLHTPLLSVPKTHAPLEDVFTELYSLPEKGEGIVAPFLEIKVVLDEPLPDLKNQIMERIQHKNVRLARIDLRLAQATTAISPQYESELELHELSPFDVLAKVYHEKFDSPLPPFYSTLLEETLHTLETAAENE